MARAYESIHIFLILAYPFKRRYRCFQCCDHLHVFQSCSFRLLEHQSICRSCSFKAHSGHNISLARILSSQLHSFKGRIHHMHIGSVSLSLRQTACTSGNFHHVSESKQYCIFLCGKLYTFVYICSRRHAYRTSRP